MVETRYSLPRARQNLLNVHYAIYLQSHVDGKFVPTVNGKLCCSKFYAHAYGLRPARQTQIFKKNVEFFRLTQFAQWKKNNNWTVISEVRRYQSYRCDTFFKNLAKLAIWIHDHCDESPCQEMWMAPAGMSKQ